MMQHNTAYKKPHDNAAYTYNFSPNTVLISPNTYNINENY